MMPEFRALPSIVYACFSRALYQDVYLRGKGLGLSYLLLLTVLIITPSIVFIILRAEQNLFDDRGELDPMIAGMMQEAASQLPELVFENGQMVTAAEQPVEIYVTMEGERQLFAMIDEQGTESDLRVSHASVLLTRDAALAKMGTDQIEALSWSELERDYFVLNADNAMLLANQGVSWLKANKLWLMVLFGVISWVGTLLVMFLYRAAQVFLFGGAALLIARHYRLPLEYPDAVRLSCFALTPPILLDVAFGLTIGDSMSLILFIAIVLGYLIFAVRSNVEVS